MENKNKIKSKGKWDKIKGILLSDEKLVFLNHMSSIELNIFIKETTSSTDSHTGNNETTHKIIYKKFNSILIEKFPCLDYFVPVEIIKPIINNSISKKEDYSAEKVDNTGNVQLWPCEEILSVFSLINKQLFVNKRIIELGSGFSGLAGLTVAKNIDQVSEVVITDGNSICVDRIKKNIQINNLEDKVKSSVLLWDRNLSFKKQDQFTSQSKFDLILISDCLFFVNFHTDLIITIDELLDFEGVCIIIAPPRGKSMDLFLKSAEDKFLIEKKQDPISFVNITKQKEDERFIPYYIELKKKSNI